jgi:enamine deaminase RidA (YjgF/YER057c/UK114 family)
MERKYINPPELASPPANLYNHVVKVGNTVYISGQVPRGLDGKAMHVGDPAAQIRQVWVNLETAIRAAGGSLQDIVKTTTYVVGAENLGKIREVRMSILPEEGRPTSTTVVVAGLADPDFLVEVEAVAELG